MLILSLNTVLTVKDSFSFYLIRIYLRLPVFKLNLEGLGRSKAMIMKFPLFAIVLFFARADLQCYPPSSEWFQVSAFDCVDILEGVLGDRMAMIPFPLTQQQEISPFPYVRTSRTCKLQIDLLQENPNSTFTLFLATTSGMDIIRSCLLSLEQPSIGGQAVAGPNSALVITLGSCVRSKPTSPKPMNPNGGAGPHGIRRGA